VEHGLPDVAPFARGHELEELAGRQVAKGAILEMTSKLGGQLRRRVRCGLRLQPVAQGLQRGAYDPLRIASRREVRAMLHVSDEIIVVHDLSFPALIGPAGCERLLKEALLMA
jgi:hypothetical protein